MVVISNVFPYEVNMYILIKMNVDEVYERIVICINKYHTHLFKQGLLLTSSFLAKILGIGYLSNEG